MKYLYLLGRNAALSLSELTIFFREKGEVIHGFFCIEVEPDETPPSLKRLGGTIKILEVRQENIKTNELREELLKILDSHFQGREGKQKFGLSLIPEPKSDLKNILISLKKESLKKRNLRLRFVNKNFENVSHVVVWNEKLISNGIDLTAVKANHEHFMIAKTLEVQNFKAYGLRDYGKPFRDPRLGMLPPKLAKIMINLTIGKSPPKNLTIVDPFCGTGTILMEALLMGFNTVGYDKNETIVAGARKNIEWLKSHYPFHGEWKIMSKDATELGKSDFSSPSAIITEPWLGPPLSSPPSTEKRKMVFGKIESLQFRFFENGKSSIPTGTPIVTVFPFFKERDGSRHFLDRSFIEKINHLGYSKADFSHSNAPLQRSTLLYDREDQIVGREIVKFMKK